MSGLADRSASAQEVRGLKSKNLDRAQLCVLIYRYSFTQGDFF